MLNYFISSDDQKPKYQMSIYQLEKQSKVDTSSFQVFLVSIQKTEEATSSIRVKESLASDWKDVPREEIQQTIRILQVEARVTRQMKVFKSGQKFEQHTDNFVNGKPRYSLIVRDSANPIVLAACTVACFVVPLGAEKELNIYDEEAQIQILDQTNMSRLVIVILGRGHKYESLDQIKEELNGQIIALMPQTCQNSGNIPYMSTS